VCRGWQRHCPSRPFLRQYTKFQRIQFTPDLLPADLIGTLIYNPKEGGFFTKKGPIFANIILADEKTARLQSTSALLEDMQERQ
jgi:MoxR-like ATPase